MLNNPATLPATMMLSRRQFFLIFALIFVCFGVIMFNRATSMICTTSSDIKRTGFDSVDQRTKRAIERQRPFIFIGGMPRSGTTLMRAMLDAHPAIRCGEETRLVPRLLAMRQGWMRHDIERKRLEEAGVTETVVEAAIAAFIYEIIVGHGVEADFLCNKDPFTLRDVDYLSRLFPNSKYLLMIRDGRATIHSIITGKVTISGFDLNNPRQCLGRWNQAIEIMYNQCVNAGPARCYQVRYENLVLHPENVTREIMRFLDIKWTDEMLRHEEHIGKDIKLSKIEPSTAHVVNPININSLTKWVGKYPPDVIRDMATIAPMLLKLGYDPNANPPDFGKPDEIVIKKTKDLHDNAKKWFDRALVAVGGDVNRVNMPAGMNMTMMNISSSG